LMKKGVNVLVKGSRFMQMERVVAALEDINRSDKDASEKNISKKAVIKKLVGEN
jgi:hypothetical protein